ncbi:hypothetical protein KKA50_00770 [Patescibacteria group bacterium]|nr:hypothetical protein [Patescibacteria group bacterium]
MAKVFNITTSQDEKVIKFYNQAMVELCEFYDIQWNENTPLVHIVPDRKTFNDLWEEKTENWVVGDTMGTNKILYILSPDAYEKDSIHKYSDGEYFGLIKHELSHLFCQILFDSFEPLWFTEGIAVYTSGQLERYEKPKQFSKFLEFFETLGDEAYSQAGFAVEILIKKIGKVKFLKALKEIKTPVTEKSFKEFFKKNFDIELSYKWFNENL